MAPRLTISIPQRSSTAVDNSCSRAMSNLQQELEGLINKVTADYTSLVTPQSDGNNNNDDDDDNDDVRSTYDEEEKLEDIFSPVSFSSSGASSPASYVEVAVTNPYNDDQEDRSGSKQWSDEPVCQTITVPAHIESIDEIKSRLSSQLDSAFEEVKAGELAALQSIQRLSDELHSENETKPPR
ncbi:hypothetical protein F5B20DRAFT_597394 [Whalleya microplaca]|nr:hypothetical protein F5B20DRAFT_597394 [Whalleya microplaca]